MNPNTEIRLPDGMTAPEAERILAEHVVWVPLPDGPTEAHVGKRVRLKHALIDSLDVIDKVTYVHPHGEVRLRAVGDNWYSTSGDWFVHPDDAPTDADLIGAMAKALDDQAVVGVDWFDMARAALAVVRDHEAQR